MFGKIKALTKIFVKDFYQGTNLVNKETKKLNTKSIYFWMLIILLFIIIYISYEAINFFVSRGAPETFLNIYMIIFTLLLMFQIAVISTNIFFFSKELEFILPLPVKSKELLIAKMNTVLIMSYFTEMLFGIPFILYGFFNFTNFLYFVWLIILLFLLPIVFVVIIGLISVILMKIFSFVRNKTILQNIINVMLILILFFIENKLIGNITSPQETNYFITPIVKILSDGLILEKIKYLFILFGVDILSLVVFIFIGQKIYLKIILKNLIVTKGKVERKNENKVEIKNKKNNLGIEYVKKETKMLFKQPIFFMQTILPVIMILITILMIANVIIPAMDSFIQSDEKIKESLSSLEFSAEMICVILGILQCIFSLSSISLTAISREGKNAIFMKYIPVSYYKQFLYKNVVQVVLNIIVSIVVLCTIYMYIPKIGLFNIILMFIISIFINLINSYLMLVVDLRKPYLNWNSEHSVIKKNDNKSFQYVLTIVMILIYMYLSNIFKDVNVTSTLGIEIMIFIILFIIIDRIVKKKSEWLFNKIN